MDDWSFKKGARRGGGIELDRDGVPLGAANAAYVRAVHDRGLSFDLQTMSRRAMLGLAGGLGALALVGCDAAGTAVPSTSSSTLSSAAAAASSSGSSASGSSSSAASTSASSTGSSAEAAATGASSAEADCAAAINSETAGPYPGDGSNGVEVRTVSGVVRNDIRSSFGSASGTAEGVPLTIALTLQDLSCQPLAGAAVYLWHCDSGGRYSLYSQEITDQNYLRGIGVSDASGNVTFTSIFPACYSGRWPHIHFEIYPSVADATSGSGTIVKTSQLALPQDVCTAVYATAGYTGSVANLDQVTLATDNVFSDDSAAHQLGAVTGSVSSGYSVSLTVPVDPSATETQGGSPGGSDGSPPGAPSGGAGPGGAPPSGGPRPPRASTTTS